MSQYNVDYNVVKKPAHEKPLTPEQAEEWLKCARDRKYWMENYVYVQGNFGKVLFKPRAYQERIIDACHEHRFVVALCGRQAGKRLSLDTLVPTPEGYTTVGEISVGDMIIGDDGRPTMVTYLSPIEENADSYKVTLSTGEEILADAEHLWTVNYRSGGGKQVENVVMNTKAILDKGLIVSTNKNGSSEKRFTINCAQKLKGTHQDLPIDPYLFGYWLGDGHSSGGRITIGKNIKEDFDRFISYCEKNDIEYSYTVDRETYLVRIVGMTSVLNDMGVKNNKHIPIQYLRASEEQREKLIQGLMDSDGTIDTKGRMEVTFKSKKLIDDTHELFSSMGTRLHTPRKKLVKTFNPEGETYYRISGTVFSSEYQIVTLPRKLKNVREHPHPRRKNSTKKRQIVSIEKVDNVPMRCIQVDNQNHLFCVTRSFVPTHNTTVLGVDALHDMIFREDYLVGITSYKLSNVKDYIARIKYAYENLPHWMKPAAVEYNKHNIMFTNNSGVVSQLTTETTFRGISPKRIISDELAFVSPMIASEFMSSILPSISAGGEESITKFNIISTPNGTEGAFPEIWFGAESKTNGFVPVEVKYEEIPGRTEKFERDMVNKIGRDKFDQEYRNKFIGSGGTLVNSRIMESLPTIEPVHTFQDLEVFVESFQGRTLGMACDVAEGIGQDNHAIQIIDLGSFEQVAEFANNMMNQHEYTKMIIKIIKYLYSNGASEIYYSIENNGLGNGVMRLIETNEDPILQDAIMISDVLADGTPTKRNGMMTTGKSKLAGCAQLKEMIETHKLKINSKKLLTELKFFIKVGQTFAAAKGAKDDRVMAMVILMNMLPQLANYETSVDETINEVDVEEETWGIF